jgi:hypothetical protein
MVTTPAGKEISYLRWWQGLIMSSVFSAVYLLTPIYNISALVTLCLQYPTRNFALIYASPLLLSILFPSTPMLFLAKYMEPMIDYFGYEEVAEISNETLIQKSKKGENFILAMQPHGVVRISLSCTSSTLLLLLLMQFIFILSQ